MSKKQWKLLDVIERVEAKHLTVTEAAAVLGYSVRHVRRIRSTVQQRGEEALVHGNKGRCPPNRVKESIREKVLLLAKGKYTKFNDQHFTEKLNEQEKIIISRSTVRRILRQGGIHAEQKRRPPRHYRRRERKAQPGLMILWDGSFHDWLEGRGPSLCLMGAIDDATGEMLPGAHFVDRECSEGYLRMLYDIASKKGLPHSIYMDRHSSLKRNDDHFSLEEELVGKQHPTQVGMALEALQIQPIFALSPQAKGRVERLWKTLQDRLCSELRLENACTCEQANRVLRQYRTAHNRKFAVQPRNKIPAWRSTRQLDLRYICSFGYEATVQNDNTIRLAGMVIDIPPGPRRRSYSKARVEVRQYLDGSWRVFYQHSQIAEAAATQVGEPHALRRRKYATAKKKKFYLFNPLATNSERPYRVPA